MTEPKPAIPYRAQLQKDLLRVAGHILEREGLAAVQARRVAQEVGCSVGTVYNVYGDLDGLIIAANTQTLRELGGELADALEAAAGRSISDRLMALAFAYMSFADCHKRRWKAVFEHSVATVADVPAAYRADQARLLSLIERVLQDGIADATERGSAARALFGAVHGIVALTIDNKLGAYGFDEMEAQIKFIVAAAGRGLVADRG